MSALWESKSFRRATGHAWRPGGLDLTARGLVLCQEFCGLSPGHLVVDLGCGPGGTVRLLQQAGYGVLGLDRQVSGAAAGDGGLAQTPENSGHRWGFAQADIARLPLAHACVQGLVCECVLSLLPDPVQVLRGFLRVLRPGGVLLFSDLTRRDEGASTVFASATASGASAAPGQGAADTGGSPQGAFVSGPGGSGKASVSPVASGAPALSATPGAYGAYDTYGKSCMDGARSVFLWEAYLRKAGFCVVHYEDHSRALVELAARMLWYGGDEPVGTPGASPGGCTCSLSGNGRKFGYGLWIAQKEHA